MDLLGLIANSDVSKIAIFILFFALVALILEVFYFRKKRVNEFAALPSNESPQILTGGGKKIGSHIMKRNLIIVGVTLILLAIPLSLYVVFQPVTLEKEAQVQQAVVACDQLDIRKETDLASQPSSFTVNDLIRFIGYCYWEGSPANINRGNFVITTPSQAITHVELAIPVPEKNSGGRQYYKSSFPNFKLTETGTYTVQLFAYDLKTQLTNQPVTKTFTVALGTQASIPTPTLTPAQAQTNKPPTCTGLSVIPLTGPAPLTVSLTANGNDTDGRISAFEFVFGDGARQTVNVTSQAASSVSTSHVYQISGSYRATATARDNSAATSISSPSCQATITVASASASTATTSANLKAQPTKIISPTPTIVTLPQAGISLPMVGFVSAGLVLLTFGLLLAF